MRFGVWSSVRKRKEREREREKRIEREVIKEAKKRDGFRNLYKKKIIKILVLLNGCTLRCIFNLSFWKTIIIKYARILGITLRLTVTINAILSRDTKHSGHNFNRKNNVTWNFWRNKGKPKYIFPSLFTTSKYPSPHGFHPHDNRRTKSQEGSVLAKVIPFAPSNPGDRTFNLFARRETSPRGRGGRERKFL